MEESNYIIYKTNKKYRESGIRVEDFAKYTAAVNIPVLLMLRFMAWDFNLRTIFVFCENLPIKIAIK